MTKSTSRRAILAGAAALPALTVPALAAPDITILDMLDQLKAELAERERLYLLRDGASERMRALINTKSIPPKPICPPELVEIWEKWPSSKAEMLPPDHPYNVWKEEMEPAWQANYDAYNEASRWASEESGYDDADADCDDAYEQVQDTFARIRDARAHTMQGLVAKLDASHLVGLEGDELFEMLESIEADIRAMAGKAVQS